MRFSTTVLALSLVGVCGADPAPNKAQAIARLVHSYQELGYLNGAVLVAERGTVLYDAGVGNADMEKHVPNTPRTRFGIASITKQFTAALVLQQAAEGKLKLQAHLSEYLPWYRHDSGDLITIEQLLHHTSGLRGDFDDPEDNDPQAPRQIAPEQFARQSCQRNLVASPGEKWAYSNCGYILLGLVLEQVTGKPFETLLKERLLSPLQMSDTGLSQHDLAEHGLAQGYTRLAGPRYKAGPYIDQGKVFSAGAMYSTTEDLRKWSDALKGGAILPPDLCAAIFTPGKGDWGYGWFVTKLPDGTTLEEMRGDMPGNYFAWIRRYPEREAVIIVLRNSYGSTEHLEENLEAILMGKDPHLPARAAKDIAASFWFSGGRWGVVGLVVLAFVFAIWRKFGS